MTTSSAATPRPRTRFGNAWWGTMFSLPGLILLGLFLILPFVFAIYLSFTNQKLASPLPVRWVGFDNYHRVLTDGDFWRAFANNLLFAAVVVPVQTGLALWMAILVNKRIRAAKVFRAIFFLPVVVVMTVAAVIWFLLLDPNRGLVNGFLGAITFGAVEPGWLQSTLWAMPAIIIMSVWQGVGFHMVIWLAGLQTIPGVLYEAAAVAGASTWQQFRYVTWPGLRNTFVFVLITITMAAFGLFTQVDIMTRGGPLDSTTTVIHQMVQRGFNKQDIAYGSAISVFFFLMVLTVALIQRYLTREND